MNKSFWNGLATGLVVAAAVLYVRAHQIHLVPRPGLWHKPSAYDQFVPNQSWDQENLKRNDAGCPTAIFVAPGGKLAQCPFIKEPN